MAVVINELLGRPLLKIVQDTDCFNFSIDSVLLASFVTIPAKTERICDLCSGNAPIPMYLSLRCEAEITGVEIQEYSHHLAEESVKMNHLEERIHLYCRDLKGISETLGKFDVVTCNPPFFKLGCHQVNPGDQKAIARHEISATLEDIVREAALLLKCKGRFAMVHRPERLCEILDVMRKYKIEPKRLRFVYPKSNEECNHILIEGIKDGAPGNLRVESPLYVYDESGNWTDEVRKIYNYEGVE